jgi:hypothetical protein
MAAISKIQEFPTLGIVDNANEYFDTYEEYKIHMNEVRKYLRRLPLGERIRFDSIPLDFQSDAVRIIIESSGTTVLQAGDEFIIFFNNLI